nr:MAG TPA: hypothetical protein [Caudoviricetes sp.]
MCFTSLKPCKNIIFYITTIRYICIIYIYMVVAEL